jgi:hypothetical protein
MSEENLRRGSLEQTESHGDRQLVVNIEAGSVLSTHPTPQITIVLSAIMKTSTTFLCHALFAATSNSSASPVIAEADCKLQQLTN